MTWRDTGFGVFVVLALNASSATAQEPEGLLSVSRETAAELMQQLGAALKAELAKDGPDAAVAVCKIIAPEPSGRVSREKGWRVSCVSLRTRNHRL